MRPTARHNRWLRRVWKLSKEQRRERLECSACLESYSDALEKPVLIMACDHTIHYACHIKHVTAYCERMEFNEQQELELMLVGAPCPQCRINMPLAYQAAMVLEDCIEKQKARACEECAPF